MMSLVKIRMLWFLQKVPPNLTINDIKIILLLCRSLQRSARTVFDENEITVNKVMESESISSALALTIQVNGITIVPLSGLHKQIIHDFIVQPIEITIPRQLIMQWSPKRE